MLILFMSMYVYVHLHVENLVLWSCIDILDASSYQLVDAPNLMLKWHVSTRMLCQCTDWPNWAISFKERHESEPRLILAKQICSWVCTPQLTAFRSLQSTVVKANNLLWHVCSYSLCSRIYSDECIFMSLNAHEDMHVYTGCNTVSTDIANVLQFQ